MPIKSPELAQHNRQNSERPLDVQFPTVSPARVEQIAVDPALGALPSRLHQRGQVIGRANGLLYVIFERDQQSATRPPHLLRVLNTPGRPSCAKRAPRGSHPTL